jgi:tetratricopeptide (TPR) repeat protein
MEKANLDKHLNELVDLNNKKQFLLVEKKARLLISHLNPDILYEYEAYIKSTFILAESLIKTARNINAIDVFEKTLQKFPNEERFFSPIYELYLKLKRIPKAEEILKQWAESCPSDLELRLKLAKLHFEKKENFKAILELKKIIALGSTEPEIYKLLISLFDKEEIYPEKLKYINLLQLIAPEDDTLIIEEIKTLMKLKEFSKSFKILDDFLNYKIEQEQFDENTLNLLKEFYHLYIILGYKESLFELFVKIIKFNLKNMSSTLKIKLEQFSKESGMENIFKFLCLPEKILLPLNPDDKKLLYKSMDNFINMFKNNKHFGKEKLKNYFEKSGIKNQLPKEMVIFLYLFMEK